MAQGAVVGRSVAAIGFLIVELVDGPHPGIVAAVVAILAASGWAWAGLLRARRITAGPSLVDAVVAPLIAWWRPGLIPIVCLVLALTTCPLVLYVERHWMVAVCALQTLAMGPLLLGSFSRPATGSQERVLVALTLMGEWSVLSLAGPMMSRLRSAAQVGLVAIRGSDTIYWTENPVEPGGLVVSGPAERLLGFPAEDWLHPGLADSICHPEDLAILQGTRSPGVGSAPGGTTGVSPLPVVRLRHRNGEWRRVEVEVRSVRSSKGRHWYFEGSLTDRTDVVELQQRAEEKLRHQAQHDALTGLPNRAFLAERLEALLSVPDRPVALLLIDLNEFKEVNDTLGHAEGDRLLQSVGRRLQGLIRSDDVVARLGGDEFAIALVDVADERRAVLTAQRVLDLLADPVDVGGVSFETSASIGIALAPVHAVGAEELGRCADVAMYAAKRAHEGFSVYRESSDRNDLRRLTMLGQLGQAIDRGELELHYQPVISLAGREMVGVEALVRWRHPLYGLLSPGEFIELAEVSGAIHTLTRWVLAEALAQVSRWRAAGTELYVAVNLSARNLYEPDLIDYVQHLLGRHGLPGQALSMEITENQILDDPSRAAEVLEGLSSLGVYASIDDFGTGYSSFASLSVLPIREIKIDRSFVTDLVDNPVNQVIVRSIIDLGRNLGVYTVAEGVETEEVAAMLASLGADRSQGYHFSRPVVAAEVDPRAGLGVVRPLLADGLSRRNEPAVRA